MLPVQQRESVKPRVHYSDEALEGRDQEEGLRDETPPKRYSASTPKSRLHMRQFQSCPSTPSNNRLALTSGSPVTNQLQFLRGSKISNDCMFIYAGDDAEDSRELTRLLPNVSHLSTISTPYMKEADVTHFRACFFLVVLSEIQPLASNTIVNRAIAACRDVTCNESLGSVIFVFITTFDVDALVEAERGFVQELTNAAMMEADGVVFSFPSAPFTVRQMQAAVQNAESWSDRLLKATSQMREALQEQCKQHTKRSIQDLVWKTPHSVFPHIPSEDPKLKERSNGVGEYTFVKKIGEGAFGTVHLANRSGNSSLCAVKVLRKDAIRGMNDLAAIERELVILRGVLNHPNVLKVQDCLHGATKLFIVMEYLGEYCVDDYVRLRQRSNRRCPEMLPFMELLGMLGHVIRAVHHCHSKHICHRDLKLTNLMIAPDGLVTLIDFGLAMQAAPGQQLFGRCGTVPYAAPEVLTSTLKKGYDGMIVDVWSFAVILVELLCGVTSTVRLIGISNGDANQALVAGCERLAEQDIQQQMLAASGEDAREYRSDIEHVLKSVFDLQPQKRPTMLQIAQMGVFSVHVGPIEQPRATPKPRTVPDKKTTSRLSTETFNSKVVVRGLARLLPSELDGRPLLELLGGKQVVRKVAETTLDWLLPRCHFADFFLTCPVKMGQIRVGIAFFLEGYLADPENYSAANLTATHSNLNISDTLFSEFVDTLIQAFRLQGVRGELVLELTRVIERLRKYIIGGYRTRLSLAHGTFESGKAMLEASSSKATMDDFVTQLATSIKRDMRIQSKYSQLNLHETAPAFAQALWAGSLDNAARVVFDNERVKVSIDQGGNGVVFLFCDNVRQVLGSLGVPPLVMQQFILQLEHISDVVVASVSGQLALSNLIGDGTSARNFVSTLLDLCRGDPQLRYYAEMPGFQQRCLPSLFTVSGDTERIREAHSRLRLSDTRYNAFMVHVDSLLRTIYPWPLHPASVCSDAMRSLEAFRGDIIGSAATGAGGVPTAPAFSQNGTMPRRPSRGPAAGMFMHRLSRMGPLRGVVGLLSTLQADPRISEFFVNINEGRWNCMASCIDGILANTATVDPEAIRRAHEKSGITQYHFDCFRECLAGSLEPGQATDSAMSRLDAFQDIVTGRKTRKCPVTGAVGTCLGAGGGSPAGT